MSPVMRDQERLRTAVVVGAGFGGIAAARSLAAAGVQVTILEGGQRVGGRASTAMFAEQEPVELGGTYFHGTMGHPLYDLACKEGLMATPQLHRWCWGFLRGGDSAPLSAKGAAEFQRGISMYQDALKTIAEGSQPHPHASMASLLKSKRAEATAVGTECEEGWAWREQLMQINSGAYSSEDVNADWWWGSADFPGPNTPCPASFQVLAERLAEGLDVRLSHLVTRITWGDNGAHVVCQGGQTFQADAVIVSVSVGVLKACHRTLFHPPLPPAKIAAIEGGIVMGTVNKVFVDFTSSTDASPDPSLPASSATNILSSARNQEPAAPHTPPATPPRGGPLSPRGLHPLPSPRDVPGLLPSREGSKRQADSLTYSPLSVPGLGPSRESSKWQGDSSSLSPVPCRDTARWQGGSAGSSDVTDHGEGAGTPHQHAGVPPWGSPWVAYHLLWGAAERNEDKGTGRSPWTTGVFSARFGGAEFKDPGFRPGGASAGQCGGGTVVPPTFSGRADAVYGNSSTEGAHMAATYAPVGLPLRDDAHPQAAVLWVSGPQALAMEELDDTTIAADVESLLNHFPALPRPPSCPPRVLATRWGTDPLFRGAYSHVTPQGSPADVDALAAPLTVTKRVTEAPVSRRDQEEEVVPVVLFCGEATHSKLGGTMGGAYLTGMREAERLLEAWSVKKAA